jgi:hypothetical protein
LFGAWFAIAELGLGIHYHQVVVRELSATIAGRCVFADRIDESAIYTIIALLFIRFPKRAVFKIAFLHFSHL